MEIKRRILLLGSNGMLGQRLCEFFSGKEQIELLCCSAEDESYMPGLEYRQLDITDKNSVKNTILNFYPDVIINAAAYTNVDKAETERQLAWNINVTAVEYIAKYAKSIDAHIIHISSDYIFDGNSGPYTEEDLPNPISYYGRTKLASENALISSDSIFTIIRTNVLYGIAKFGRNDFVKWVIDSLQADKTITIVNDQVNNPTFTEDLVFAINSVIEFNKFGVYNIGGPEFLTRYDFTLRIADYFDLKKELILKINTSSLNQPARRPLKSGLIILKAQSEFGYKPHSFDESFLIINNEQKFKDELN